MAKPVPNVGLPAQLSLPSQKANDVRAFGPDARQRYDVFAPAAPGPPRDIVVFFHAADCAATRSVRNRGYDDPSFPRRRFSNTEYRAKSHQRLN